MAERKLGQDAIDEMFRGRGASERAAGSAAATEPFHFGRANQISGEQVRAIRTVSDQFTRNLTHTLGAWLRTGVQITVAAVEQMAFAEYMDTVEEPAFLTVLRLEPLGGAGLLELDAPMSLRVVDLLLGGQGDTPGPRALTEIETAILGHMVEIIARELNATWGTVGLRFVAEPHDGGAESGRLMTPNERTLCLRLELHMLQAEGVLNLCLPAVVLNTVHRRLLSVRERPRRRQEGGRARLAELLAESASELHAELPLFPIGAARMRGLRAGDVLHTPWPATTAASLMMAARCVAQARLVQHGEHRGAQLLPEPCAAAESPEAARA